MKRFYHEPSQTSTNKMKINFAVSVVILLLALAFVMLAMACGGFFEPEITELDGTWVGGSGKLIVSANIFTFYDANEDVWYQGTLTYSNGRITLTINRYSKDGVNYYEKEDANDGDELPTTLEGTYEIDGDNLSMDLEDNNGEEYEIELVYTPEPPPPPEFSPSSIELTLNEWTDGNFAATDEEQWFKFTATTSTTNGQYIHVAFGTLKSLYVQLYDSTGNTVGSRTNLSGSTRYINRTLTSGKVYYIKVQPESGNSGNYQITFNASSTPPSGGIWLPPFVFSTLTRGVWADGNIAASSGEQWFAFTATASTQYIHVTFGTLDDLYVQLYDSSGNTVGARTNLRGATRHINRAVTVGQTYYIKVQPGSNKSGSYQIAFNSSSVTPGSWTPPAASTSLNIGEWVSGNTTTSIREQWYSFTATASQQYIHVTFGTLKDLYVQLYASDGDLIGNAANLRNSDRSLNRIVTVGEIYYFRVWPYSGSGNFQVAFNESSARP
jgi:stress response protein SCP2